MNAMTMTAHASIECGGVDPRFQFTSLWQHLLTWRQQRQLRRKLYGIEPRLLLDMGLDPAQVYGADEGTLGEIHGDRFRGLFPLTNNRRRRQ